LRRVEGPVNPFQKRVNLLDAYTDRVESQNSLGKFHEGPLPVGKKLGKEIALSYGELSGPPPAPPG